MSISAGSRLGPYEVLAKLGEGGMGEVWKARDTRLDRNVAIKILPDALANNPDRLARFEREAKTLAALNHPHIAAIYGLEDTTTGRAIVMELVEGEALADRIAGGPVPLDEALAIARQIADALDAAHERDIVHRDLKPANIKLTADSTVKVLDFGLAKLVAPSDVVQGLSPAVAGPEAPHDRFLVNITGARTGAVYGEAPFTVVLNWAAGPHPINGRI